MKKFFVVCDNIRSLENIGSIFRTADALMVNKIFLCGISGSSPTNFELDAKGGKINPKLYSKLVGDKPPNDKISKAALGAEKNIPFEHHWQTWKVIDKLKKPACRQAGQKFQVVALEQAKNSVIYTKFKPKFPLALILGNEIKGVSKSALKRSDKIIHLPMLGKKESLNVAVAFGVAGYEINKYRN